MLPPLPSSRVRPHANSLTQMRKYVFRLPTIPTSSRTRQTPVWNQPEPGPVGLDDTEANIDDDDDEPELTIHEREHHELRWPQDTRLVHPPRGRWSLRVQNRSVKAVVQDAFPLAQRYVASINAFPYGREKVEMGRDALFHAATEGEFTTIADRLSRDRWYGQWLSPLVRVSHLCFQCFLTFHRLTLASASSVGKCGQWQVRLLHHTVSPIRTRLTNFSSQV